MNSIRRISLYDRSINDRYYITDSGTVYSLCKDRKAMKDGERRTVNRHLIKEAISLALDWFIPFKDWGMYCIVLPDGKVLRRLSTHIKKPCNSITVCIANTAGGEVRAYVARLVANSFLEDVKDKEVHHIDRDRTNNCLANLMVLTREDHIELHREAGY